MIAIHFKKSQSLALQKRELCMKNEQYFFYFGPFNFTRVVCKQHFQDDQIKILNDIFEKLGNFEDNK